MGHPTRRGVHQIDTHLAPSDSKMFFLTILFTICHQSTCAQVV